MHRTQTRLVESGSSTWTRAPPVVLALRARAVTTSIVDLTLMRTRRLRPRDRTPRGGATRGSPAMTTSHPSRAQQGVGAPSGAVYLRAANRQLVALTAAVLGTEHDVVPARHAGASVLAPLGCCSSLRRC